MFGKVIILLSDALNMLLYASIHCLKPND